MINEKDTLKINLLTLRNLWKGGYYTDEEYLRAVNEVLGQVERGEYYS